MTPEQAHGWNKLLKSMRNGVRDSNNVSIGFTDEIISPDSPGQPEDNKVRSYLGFQKLSESLTDED